MGPIEYALNDIRHKIPKEVLEEAFGVKSYGNLVSLDYRIREAVVEDRVRKDCNITGGEEYNIDLTQCQLLLQDNERAIYVIPQNILHGRKIISAISAGYVRMNTRPTLGINTGAALPDINMDILNSNMPVETTTTTEVFITGENTVMIEGVGYNHRLLSLTAIVSYNDSFSGVDPRAWPVLSNMIYEAVRAYCHNKLIVIKSRKGLQGGIALGAIEEIIDSYSGAEELYQEYVRVRWPKVALLSNDRRRKNHVRLITNML